MKLRLTLDTAAIGIIVLLAVFVGLTVLAGAQAGVRVSANLPERGLIGPLQTIELTFSESVDPNLTEALLSIQPALDGRFEWLDSRSMQFVPAAPFELDTVYKLTLLPGRVSATGRELKKQQAWEFSVRAPWVAYLASGENQSSIWAMDLNGNPPRRLTDEKIKVISFDVAKNGELIIFTSVNGQGGIDLWRIPRAGGEASLLLDCARDRCTTPAIAPNGYRIAYSREAAGPGPDLPFGSPRIWILDLQSGQNGPVYEDRQILGYNPSWSPDSNKLVSYDGLADRINLLDLTDNKRYIFPSNTGGPVTWSPDSTRFLFTIIEQKEDGLRTQVRLADLSLNDSMTLIGSRDNRDYSYYSIAWSPLEEKAVLGFRAGDEKPSQILWLFDPSMLEGIVIAGEENYTYNSPQWDPWGGALIFQQFKLRGAFNPEIGVWKPGFSAPLILAQGLMPRWLP